MQPTMHVLLCCRDINLTQSQKIHAYTGQKPAKSGNAHMSPHPHTLPQHTGRQKTSHQPVRSQSCPCRSSAVHHSVWCSSSSRSGWQPCDLLRPAHSYGGGSHLGQPPGWVTGCHPNGRRGVGGSVEKCEREWMTVGVRAG